MISRPRRLILFCLISVLLHGSVVAWLFWPDSQIKSPEVSIYIEYRKSEDSKPAAAVKKARIAKTQKISPPQPAASVDDSALQTASLSQAGKGAGGEDSLAVMGAELGIHASYPRLSRVLGERGKVLIEIQKDSRGSLEKPFVIESSHFARLDQSALTATEDALKRGLLERVLENRRQVEIGFIFKLNDGSKIAE